MIDPNDIGGRGFEPEAYILGGFQDYLHTQQGQTALAEVGGCRDAVLAIWIQGYLFGLSQGQDAVASITRMLNDELSKLKK